jgi:hypothetical protein
MRLRVVFSIVTACAFFNPPGARCQWIANGLALSTDVSSQERPRLAADSEGGVIIVWNDFRNGNGDIYAQKVDAWGYAQWAPGGVAVASTPLTESFPTVVSDGAGGAIVAFVVHNAGTVDDIYAQRVNYAGAPKWTAGGVSISTEAFGQNFPEIVSDGASGAIVTFQDARDGAVDVYAQRVNAAGNALWTINGVALSTAEDVQRNPMIASDGVGGAIVTWWDLRTGIYDIYAQRVNNVGIVLWATDGVAVCAAPNYQSNPMIVADDVGGAIVVWEDFRTAPADDIYVQRVNASGVPQWTADGVALCTESAQQDLPMITSDGAEGAVVAWRDFRPGATSDVYVRRVTNTGAPQWTANGVGLCTAAGNQSLPMLTSDGAGGAIVTWRDSRSGAASDIYAARVSDLGAPLWAANGVAVCAASNSQTVPRIDSNGAGAFVAWQDSRAGDENIFVQRMTFAGEIPTAVDGPARSPLLIVSEAFPNPFAGTTSFDVELHAPATVQIGVFDVAGRSVRSMTLGEAISHRVEFDGRDDQGRVLPSGVYFCRVHAAGEAVTRKIVIAR